MWIFYKFYVKNNMYISITDKYLVTNFSCYFNYNDTIKIR